MAEEKKDGRGGKRDGSGRPVGSVKTGTGGNSNLFQVKLPNEAADWLREAGGNARLKELALTAWRDATGQQAGHGSET